MSSSNETTRLADLSVAIRESTLKRLRRVPAGSENWRPSPGALSFGDIAHHLLEADLWLLRKLVEPELGAMTAKAGEAGDVDTQGFASLIDRLELSGQVRSGRIEKLAAADLERLVPDDRFGGDVTLWWVIVRGNLDHEAHHRGQLATYLRIVEDRESGSRG
jgi:uncharacterized damage-inducible protein DinB